jgi:hypothetical protein
MMYTPRLELAHIVPDLDNAVQVKNAVCKDRHWTVHSLLVEFSMSASALCMQFYRILNVTRHIPYGFHVF